MDFQFLKARYDFELARRDALTAALALPVAILTALGSLIAGMARTFDYSRSQGTVPFLASLSVDVLAFVIALYFMARAYHGQVYRYLPTLGGLRRDLEALTAYFEANGGEPDLATAEFYRQFEVRLIEAADYNCETNDRRSGHLHRARQALLVVLTVTCIMGAIHVAVVAM